MRTEIIYKTNDGNICEEKVNSKLSTVFKNRDPKNNTRDLYWLNHTRAPVILIEACFVDSKADTDYYTRSKYIVVKLIAEGILNKSIKEDFSQDTFEYTLLCYGEVYKAIAIIMYFYINKIIEMK
ncbi:N-acetylmuramoyl-L-alanine amidase [Clostridioides sp. ES-S-0005-03]|uniref:N-acetylmuramoyl-L-alanine amidase n=1 Tax=Clostridioides sp. ES-S-0005-03 TaxID=2770774 RepID=UPI001D0F84AA